MTTGSDHHLLRPAEPLGVYVHFPWCLAKCPYCDFLSVVGQPSSIPHEAYANAMLTELSLRASEISERRLRSVFFGGGTPSLWEPAQLGRVLSSILSRFRSGSRQVEVTVECNPSSFNADKARQLLDVGVTRFSLGIQSLNDQRLQFLGRLHDARQGLCAVTTALESGAQVSADLIFGVAGQSERDAVAEADAVAQLGVHHLSCYALTIEGKTPFFSLARAGKLPLLSEDVVAGSFTALHDHLESLGYCHYEISNYARPGFESVHNCGYWKGFDYLGLGTGAWGTLSWPKRYRYRNTQNPDRYLNHFGAASSALAATGDSLQTQTFLTESGQTLEELDGDLALKERILLGLRLREGLCLEEEARKLGVEALPLERQRAIRKLVVRGLLEHQGGRLRVPTSAWLFSDGIIAELL